MIANTLVVERLVACFNIIPCESVYHWQGRMEDHGEFLLIGKTRKHLMEEIIKTAKSNHSYQTPCIIFLHIVDGNPEYLKWIKEETKD
ncbi:MAG: divalent-cation tolerance protein CutA [Candidatus Aenigmarchaeota archaeon]|nr:divalent-cation tolerance protein CutA [Candidatus Aenigmarchaeota archaeon]